MQQLINEPTMQVYAICAAILVLKMWLTGNATGIMRILRASYITAEDVRFAGKGQVGDDPLVERLRRVHRNDLENILPFLAVGFLYALTGPSYAVAWWLLTIYTVSRIAHTVCYVASWQPWRTVIFEIGNFILLAIIVLLLVAIL